MRSRAAVWATRGARPGRSWVSSTKPPPTSTPCREHWRKGRSSSWRSSRVRVSGQYGGLRAVGQPFGLLQEAGPEEVPEVAAEGVRAAQPALVAAQAVRVEAEQQVPGGVRARGEPGVGQGPLGQPEHGGAAHRLVGVRARDHEGLAAAVADGEEPQGGARAGGARPAQSGVRGMAGDEGGGPGAQFVDGRVAEEGRQGTPPQCGAVGSPGVHGVRTVSHDLRGTSTPRGAKGILALRPYWHVNAQARR